MHHLLELAYDWYCVAYVAWRYYKFMEKHHDPKARVTTLFSGEK